MSDDSKVPSDRAFWHKFVHEFALEHWPYSHPDDYDPTDEQLIDLCLAAIERDRTATIEACARDLMEAAGILRGVQAWSRQNMVPSGEVDAWLTRYDARALSGAARKG